MMAEASGRFTAALAVDLMHQRRVAVKVLRQEFAATVGVDRFNRRVAQLVRQ